MIKRLFGISLLTILTALLLSFSAMAAEEEKDYRIYEAWWDWEVTDQAIATWEKPESATNYYIRLLRGNKVVMDWKKVTTRTYDFSTLIVNKGTGVYTFEVYPAKGGIELAVVSDELEVDSSMRTAYKKKTQADAKAKAAADGWHSYPNNLWTYGKGNLTLAKSEWLDINGATYYFDGDGYMATGWKQISGVYYYFDPKDGYLYRNTVTPDGYIVNANGAWVDASGNIAKTTSTGSSNASNKLAKSVSFSLSESGADGIVRNAAVTGCSHGDIVSYSFSAPYETWQPGSSVRLTVVVNPRKGYYFGANSTYSCTNCKFEKAVGTSPVTVTFSYTPRMKLTAPQNLYIGYDGVLHWLKVPKAGAYRVKVSGNGISTKSYIVTEPQFDPLEKLNGDFETIDMKVSALYKASGTSNSYLESNAVSLGDVNVYEVESEIYGEFGGSSEKMYYTDESGERVEGWQEIAGKWYYFGTNKLAVGPGWFQDKDQNWYYFDTAHVMQVGWINDGKADYFMNDGTNPAYPYGAWVQQ